MSMVSRRGSRTYLSLFATTMLALGAACGGDDTEVPADTTSTNVDGGADGDNGAEPGSAPVAAAQSVTTTVEAPLAIALAATDADGQPLTYAIDSAPVNGTLSAVDAATGLVTYTPGARFVGEDSFSFTASDGTLTSAPAEVKITVTDAALAVAQGQAVTTAEDTAKEITLVASGGVAPVTFAVDTQPSHGTLGPVVDGKVTYTPAANYAGGDYFFFTAKGTGAAKTTAGVSITVSAVNDPAVAVAKNLTGFVGAPMAIKLTATDVDNPNGPFTFAVANATNGTLSAVAGDTVTFTPTATGNATFTYTANDGSGAGAAATVTIDVKAAAASCAALLGAGVVTSGTYTIDADGAGAIPARQMVCDQTNDGGGWTRVFHHDSTAGFFADKAAAASSNTTDPTNARYSVLSDLEAFRANGGFEFKIDWPLAPTVYNIWQQTSNPVTAAAAGDRVTGYRGVRIDAHSQKWGGLELSTTADVLLDGSVRHQFFWYGIGEVNGFGAGIPAAEEIGGNGTTTEVELWVRPIPTCGNGKKESLETCDDGNVVNGDGCSSTCALERTNKKTCREILAAGAAVDGTYVIDADGVGGGAPFTVYCDMTNDGGGWTLIGKAGQGNFLDLTDADYLALIAEPTADVNVGALTEGTSPGTSTMAFFNKAHTNALFAAGGKVVRVDMIQNQGDVNANGLYFQKKVTPPADWDFWAGLRDARLWNDNGATTGSDVANFGTQFVLGKGAAQYTPATDAVAYNGDGGFGWWSEYTHTLSDASSFKVSRHGGLLGDGIGPGWTWLLTFDKNDARWRNDVQSLAKSRIWLR